MKETEEEFFERLPTPPPEINMKIESKHVDFGTLLPSLAELEDFRVCYQVFYFIFRKKNNNYC